MFVEVSTCTPHIFESDTTQKKNHMELESWEEIVENLRQAEERWQRLLKESSNPGSVEKPEILHLGPKPRTIKRQIPKEEEVKFEIFPLPKPRKNRGDVVNRCKQQLTLLRAQLSQETNEDRRKLFETSINKQKDEIKAYRKQKKKATKVIKCGNK